MAHIDILKHQFSDQFMMELELQQKLSVLSSTVTEVAAERSKSQAFCTPTSINVGKKVEKYVKYVPNEPNYRWRRITSSPFLDYRTFTDEDQVRTGLSISSGIASQFAAGLMRAKDQMIIEALIGDAYEGTDTDTFDLVPFDNTAYDLTNKSGGQKLNLPISWEDGLMVARRAMVENHNVGQFNLVVTPRTWYRFLKDSKNQPFWNSENFATAQLIGTGTIGNIYGLNIVMIETDLLSSVATGNANTNFAIIYSSAAIGMVTLKAPAISVIRSTEYHETTTVTASADMGAARLIDRGVFKIEFDLT